MELALGAMASLAPKLGDLLMQEYVEHKGLRPAIESLSRELVAMKAGLEDSSRVPPEQLTEMEKLWARQVRELSYDMEDAVDDFILRVAGGEFAAAATDANVFKTILGKATALMKFKDLHQIAGKVKDIKKLSNELAEHRAKYTVRGAGADLAASTGIDPRVLNLYKTESDLVGIKESRDKVIRMLSIGTKDDAQDASIQSLKIVSIVGVGGLGKTTLAKTVHDMLKEQFVVFVFISVGRTPNLARIFEKMLQKLDQKYSQVDMARWDVEQFLDKLQKLLENKRYFIVVDDIWDKGSWEAIRYALKDNNCGSRIIMTSRNFEVVTKEEEVYRLKPLSKANSKKLFFKRIQSQEGENLDGAYGDLSSKIIDKCDGIPLAIIAIASLLAKRPCEDWPKIYDSIGFGSGDTTTKILSYSYYDLPSYLKPCLLYLSKFHEDSILDTKSVIWMWIGEGFVHFDEKSVGSLFEVGERYFKELVNRSMIKPIKDTFDRFREVFCFHDIVFDLICKLSEDENFVTILDSKEKKTRMPHSDSKVRRLTVQNHHVQRFPEDTMDMPKVLRSLNIVDSKIGTMASLHSFRLCRVINIKNCSVPINLNHLGRLLHLKYLEISYTPVAELPNEIGHLKSLQTLVLVNTGLHELPRAVCSLTQLVCLVAEGFRRFPLSCRGATVMKNLTSLEELRLDSVDGQSATKGLVLELGKLMRLRVLHIIFSEEIKESLQQGLVQSLCNLRELQELVLSTGAFDEWGATVWEDWKPPRQLRRLMIRGITFLRLPGWINHSRLPNLFFLSLFVYIVEVQDLDNLGRLPELSYLNLKFELERFSWPPGYVVGTNGFKNLRFCSVGTAFKFHMDVMPRLEELHFQVFAGHWCWEQNGVPLEKCPTKDVIEGALDLGLHNLLSLEKVSVVVDCLGATAAEVQEVEAMVTSAVENHPNRPTIQMRRICDPNMISDERREALLTHHLETQFKVLEWKDEPDASFSSRLRLYRRLQTAVIYINCSGATISEVEKVEAALTYAAEAHLNHPTIQLIRRNTNYMCDKEIQDIEANFGVLELKDKPDALFIRYLGWFRRLEKAVIHIDCAGTSMCEVEKVEAAFRLAAEAHPNHPAIQLIRTNTDEMVSSSDNPDTELDEDHDDSPDNCLGKLQLEN